LRERHVELESIAQREVWGSGTPGDWRNAAAHSDARSVRASDAARSLVADFAGARDIAQRRRRGETSVPRLPESPQASVPPPFTRGRRSADASTA
jgi:hypothetical protein